MNDAAIDSVTMAGNKGSHCLTVQKKRLRDNADDALEATPQKKGGGKNWRRNVWSPSVNLSTLRNRTLRSRNTESLSPRLATEDSMP